MGSDQKAFGQPVRAHGAVAVQGRCDALQRLRIARGHLDAVVRMLEADRYCLDVLYQLAAVEGALARARREILQAHVLGCVVDAAGDGGVREAVEEVLAAVLGDRPPSAHDQVRAVP